MNTDKLKRRLFCCFYVKLGNVCEAALMAGFPKEAALYEGMKTLSMPQFADYIQELSGNLTKLRSTIVNTGLDRLAFGSSNDAAMLVFSDELPTPAQIKELDLFNVSEIKRVKGGGVEVKLFDRQKALEKIFEISSSTNSENSAASFINAITGSDTMGGDDA